MKDSLFLFIWMHHKEEEEMYILFFNMCYYNLWDTWNVIHSYILTKIIFDNPQCNAFKYSYTSDSRNKYYVQGHIMICHNILKPKLHNSENWIMGNFYIITKKHNKIK